MEIICVKARHNARGETTTRRFLIYYMECYYEVVAKKDNCNDDTGLYNIEINEMKCLTSREMAIDYGIRIMKGRNIITDEHISSEHVTVLIYSLATYRGGYHEVQRQLSSNHSSQYTMIDHDFGLDLGRFDMNLDDVDTASDLNCSDCSGDTRFGVIYNCDQEVRQLADISDDNDDDVNDEFRDSAYQDTVGFRKSLDIIQLDSYKSAFTAYWSKKDLPKFRSSFLESTTLSPDVITVITCYIAPLPPTPDELRAERIARWQSYSLDHN